MRIVLLLSFEGQLEAYVYTDVSYSNPKWALDWTKANLPSKYGRNGFSSIGGFMLIPADKILSFFEAFINNSNEDRNWLITKRYEDAVPPSRANIVIPSVEIAEILFPKIKQLVAKSTVTQNEFEELKLPLQKIQAEDQLIIQFFNKHDTLLKADKKKIFGFLRKTELTYAESLSDIIVHAQKEDNRSRRALVALGWMNQDGSITDTAPDLVKDAYNELNSLSKKM